MRLTPDDLKLIGILMLAAALRIPGIFWGEIDRPSFIVLEPDEFQHVDLAADYLRQWDDTMGYALSYPFWNARGYGFQLACVAYIGERLGWVKAKTAKLTLLGRFLSTAYALALLVLVYRFSRFLFKDTSIALLAALLLAVFDLQVTYSHYALPASAYLFWTHATVFAAGVFFYRLDQYIVPPSWRIIGREWKQLLLIPLCAGLSFAVKFDFIPLAIAGLALLVLLLRRQLSFVQFLLLGTYLVLASMFFFFAVQGFTMDLQDLLYSLDIASGLNQNAIPEDDHLWYNPLLYLLGAMAGVGLPVFLSALAATYRGILRVKWPQQLPERVRHTLLLWLAFLALEFVARWLLDTPFIRRVNFLLPYLASLAAVGLLMFTAQKTAKVRRFVLLATVLYTLAITLTSQSNFWRDTRYRAIPYLQELVQDRSVLYSGYAWVPGMPGDPNRSPEDPDLIVAHETFYGRYYKYFTTPFKMPTCCAEVYNCRGLSTCQFYQQLLQGQTDYRLVRIFPTLEVMPERWLFKKWFGTYETFVGDLRVYAKASVEE